MKRENPWWLPLILFAFSTVAFYVCGVITFVKSDLPIAAAIFFGVALGVAVMTGFCLSRAKEIYDWNKGIDALKTITSMLEDFVEDCEKAKSEEPFREFANTDDLPFPEARGEKNE